MTENFDEVIDKVDVMLLGSKLIHLIYERVILGPDEEGDLYWELEDTFDEFIDACGIQEDNMNDD